MRGYVIPEIKKPYIYIFFLISFIYGVNIFDTFSGKKIFYKHLNNFKNPPRLH